MVRKKTKLRPQTKARSMVKRPAVTKVTKRNPQDTTLRNLRALKKQISELRADVDFLQTANVALFERLRALEDPKSVPLSPEDAPADTVPV